MATAGHGRREHQRTSDAAQDRIRQHEVPVFLAKPEDDHAHQNNDRSRQQEEPGPLGVENRADLQTPEEQEERVYSEDPSDGTAALVRELVVRYPGLETS